MSSEEDKLAALLAAIETAKTNAEAFATAAQTFKNNAEPSATAAEAAKARAETAATAAEGAKTTAEAAKVAVDAAKARTETAAAAAETAKNTADNLVTATSTASIRAEASATAADTAKNKAEASLGLVDTLKSTTEAHSIAAQAAQTNAENAFTAADAAKTKAETSADAAALAHVNATDYASSASAAKTSAESSAAEADAQAKLAFRAHHLSTTAGLAGAFNSKARTARLGQIVWVIILGATLIIIGRIGRDHYERVAAIIEGLIAQKEPVSTVIGTQFLLSALSVAAPVWLAWISSKMISKQFLLSEDYSYKAAISKAYMGFKDQASQLDPIFEARLFAAAITQLDSNPLRLIESSSHPGSPLQDLLQQPFMQSVLENESFKEKITAWLNKRFKTNFYIERNTVNFGIAEPPKPPDSAV